MSLKRPPGRLFAVSMAGKTVLRRRGPREDLATSQNLSTMHIRAEILHTKLVEHVGHVLSVDDSVAVSIQDLEPIS